MNKKSAISGVGFMVLAACSSTNTPSFGNTLATGQKLAIGSACTADTDCGTAAFSCIQGDHPGGYCTRTCDIKNVDSDCPGEAICQFDGTAGECHKKCGGQSDCRTGYVCAPASTAAGDMASHAYCDSAGMAGMGDAGMNMDAGSTTDAGGMKVDGGSMTDSGSMKMDSGSTKDSGGMIMDGAMDGM